MNDDDLFSEAFKQWYQVALFIVVVLSTIFTLILFTLPSQYDPYLDKALRAVNEEGAELDLVGKDGEAKTYFKQGRTTHIVVLGDIGRSPRMQYHALSIAKHGARVCLIGYQESEMHPDIVSNALIEVVPLVAAPQALRSSSKLLFPLLAPLKALWQARSLYRALAYRTKPARYLLVQNPPSIPTLAIASFISFARNTELIVDWHNFGYSILGLKLGRTHPLVRISSWYESFFSRFATQHFAVTEAMTRVLKQQYGVSARTLHDRPAAIFQPINSNERNAVLSRLPETAQYAHDLQSFSKTPWKLLVSSTSWTPDEDFSILLDALSIYSTEAITNPKLPKILALITGKGPLKEHYLSRIQTMNQQNQLSHVVIQTAWLTPEDYALLLAAADLGVSLHTSSSGVDLPMKVVDMFGAGLPVLGWGQFEAWPELVKEDVNGKGFGSSTQLAQQFRALFGGDGRALTKLKQGAMKESEHRWDEEWDRVGGRAFRFV